MLEGRFLGSVETAVCRHESSFNAFRWFRVLGFLGFLGILGLEIQFFFGFGGSWGPGCCRSKYGNDGTPECLARDPPNYAEHPLLLPSLPHLLLPPLLVLCLVFPFTPKLKALSSHHLFVSLFWKPGRRLPGAWGTDPASVSSRACPGHVERGLGFRVQERRINPKP